MKNSCRLKFSCCTQLCNLDFVCEFEGEGRGSVGKKRNEQVKETEKNGMGEL